MDILFRVGHPQLLWDTLKYCGGGRGRNISNADKFGKGYIVVLY